MYWSQTESSKWSFNCLSFHPCRPRICGWRHVRPRNRCALCVYGARLYPRVRTPHGWADTRSNPALYLNICERVKHSTAHARSVEEKCNDRTTCAVLCFHAHREAQTRGSGAMQGMWLPCCPLLSRVGRAATAALSTTSDIVELTVRSLRYLGRDLGQISVLPDRRSRCLT